MAKKNSPRRHQPDQRQTDQCKGQQHRRMTQLSECGAGNHVPDIPDVRLGRMETASMECPRKMRPDFLTVFAKATSSMREFLIASIPPIRTKASRRISTVPPAAAAAFER